MAVAGGGRQGTAAARPRGCVPDADRWRGPRLRVARPGHRATGSRGLPGLRGRPHGRVSRGETSSEQPRRTAAGVPVQRDTPASRCPLPHAQGPYAVAADDHVRAVEVFGNADAPLQDIVLRLYRETALVARRQRGQSQRLRYSPAGGVPPGDYFVEVCEYDDDAPPVEPRTYRGTVTLDTTAAPAAYTARWTVFGANPPLHTLSSDPWNQPSTDTRERWCWRMSLRGLHPRRRQPRLTRPVGSRHADGGADVDDDRQQRCHRRVVDASGAREPDPVPAGQRAARLHVRVDERVEPRRLQPRYALWLGVRPGPVIRRRGRGHEPVRDAPPDARLVLSPRLHRGELGAHATTSA